MNYLTFLTSLCIILIAIILYLVKMIYQKDLTISKQNDSVRVLKNQNKSLGERHDWMYEESKRDRELLNWLHEALNEYNCKICLDVRKNKGKASEYQIWCNSQIFEAKKGPTLRIVIGKAMKDVKQFWIKSE